MEWSITLSAGIVVLVNNAFNDKGESHESLNHRAHSNWNQRIP